MNVLLIINPAAGNQNKSEAVRIICEKLKTDHHHFELFWTQPDSFTSGALAQQLKNRYSTIFVLGGDGTINQVINSMSDFSVPLALFPLGSGNDFSRIFQLPQSLDAQIGLALHDKISQTDLFSCNGRLFANGVGIGFDGQVAEKMLRMKNRGEMAYMYLVVKTLLGYRVKQINLQSPNFNYKGKSFMLTVATGRFFGGFCLTPKALADDGWLDVSLVKDTPVWKRPFLIASFKKGNQLTLPYIEYQRCAELKISCQNVFAHIDGEYGGMGNFEFSSANKKLKVKALLKF